MHSKYGKVGGMECLGQGASGWDGAARVNGAARGNGAATGNGHTGRMGCLGVWGSTVGWSTQEEWGTREGWGAPSPSPAAWERAAELHRGSTCGCREGKGLTGFGYPPLC